MHGELVVTLESGLKKTAAMHFLHIVVNERKENKLDGAEPSSGRATLVPGYPEGKLGSSC